MAESLKEQLNEDIKDAMRARDQERLGTLRSLSAAIKQKEVDERTELDDAAVTALVEKQIKQRRESAEQYEAGNRPELADRERREIAVLENYLPAPLSEAELDRLINDAIAASDAQSMRDMGQVMNALKPQVQGRADMSAVSARVKARLGG